MATPRSMLLTVKNTLKLVSVEPYLFFAMFGQTIRQVTFQSLLIESSCRNLHLYSDEICENLDDHKSHQELSIEAANNLYAGVMLLSSLPAIIVAIFLGPWSDKYSRKYPLIISACGQVLEATVSAILTFFPRVSPVWYVVASILAGFSGGFIVSFSSAFSYLSDVTDERSRSTRYAVLEFSYICSIVLGNILGGEIYRISNKSPIPIMIIAPCSFGIAILYAIFFVRETIPKPDGLKCSDMFRDLVTMDNVKESYKTCSKKRPGNIRKQIWCLMWSSCSLLFCEMGTLAIAFSFARYMYKWDVTEFSHASITFYVANAFAIIVIIPILANKLRLHEAALGLIGMLSLTSKMVITSVAYKPGLFYYGWMCGALNNASLIAIRARLSKLVSKDELGRAFSLLATCESVTPLLGTLVFSQIFNASYNVFPGMAFAVAAIFLIPCLVIFGWMMSLPTVSVGDYAKEEMVETKHTRVQIASSITSTCKKINYNFNDMINT